MVRGGAFSYLSPPRHSFGTTDHASASLHVRAGIKKFMGLRKPQIDLYAKTALAVYTTVQVRPLLSQVTVCTKLSCAYAARIQLASFGFSKATVPDQPELQEALVTHSTIANCAQCALPVPLVVVTGSD